MRPVGSLLDQFLKNLGIEEGVSLLRLQRDWPGLLGPPIPSHTFPVDLTEGELLLLVDSPAWLQELKFHRTTIAERLQSYAVRSVKLKYGSLPRQKGRGHSRRMPSGMENEERAKLHEADKAWVEKTVCAIPDPGVRDAIRSAVEKALTHKKKV